MNEELKKSEEDTAVPSVAKKQKMSIPQASDEEWPDAWMMAGGDVDDQKNENRQDPNVKVTAMQMRSLGVQYWKMDADAYDYPIKAVPWDPKDATDPRLRTIRDERGYSYADIISE